MNALGVLQILLYIAVLVALVKPLGTFMAKVYEGERTFLTPVLGPIERGIYRLAGIQPSAESNWKRYALAVLLFNFIGFVVVYLLQRLQGVLPLNPQDFAGSEPRLVVQHRGELRHQHQLAGLRRRSDDELSHADARPGACRTFVSAASGMAVLVALIRGFARRQARATIGNF